MLTQAIRFGFRIGEVSCPTRYAPESSSIGFSRAVRYGFGCLASSLAYMTSRWGIWTPRFLSPDGRRLATAEAEAQGRAARGRC
jgi:hypothetical protein